MNVGLLLIFQNYQGEAPDAQMVREQIRIAELVEPLGYDALWPPEHHFTDYSACPDNVQFPVLHGREDGAHPARHRRRDRALERSAAGRGRRSPSSTTSAGGAPCSASVADWPASNTSTSASRMDSSRDRFDEASQMIIEGLETGFVEGEGPYYPQVRTEVRPRPLSGFRDRFYSVGISPESVEQVAKLGARLMVFSQTPWEMFKGGALAAYRKAWGGAPGRSRRLRR